MRSIGGRTMVNFDLESRRKRHAAMSTRLAFLNGTELGKLIKPIRPPRRGWGSSGVARLGATNVFVKRIPVTQIEAESVYSTKNHYRLPTYYSYGIGSVGLGVWREIVAAIKTTSWVLDGSCLNFPPLYHHRIQPLRGRRTQPDPEQHAQYIKYWNNNRQVGRFVEDRANATHEAVLVMEFIPYTLRQWLSNRLDHTGRVFEQMASVTEFMRSKGMVHFDCHHSNVVTDGNTFYLTDFGLTMDTAFELSTAERKFFARNTFCDQGAFISRSCEYMADKYQACSASKRARILAHLSASTPVSGLALEMLLLKNVENLTDTGLLRLHPDYVEQMVKFRDAGMLMTEFFQAMIAGSRKTTRLANDQLGKALQKP